MRNLLAVAVACALLAVASAWALSPQYPLGAPKNLTIKKHQSFLFIDTIEDYPAKFWSVNTTRKIKVGIDVSPEMFNFGNISLSTQARKKITLRNPTKRYAKVRVIASGNLSKFFRCGSWNGEWHEQRSFILKPGEEKTIDVGVVSEKPGYYEGTVRIFSRLSRSKLADILAVLS